MKNLFILMLVVLGTAACSKDDDNKSTSVEKQISKITYYDDGICEGYSIYDYDNQGRITRINSCENLALGEKWTTETFTYTGNKIIYTDDYIHQNGIVYNLNSEGLITSSDEGEQYIYNEDNQLVMIKWGSGYNHTYTWKDGNIIQETQRSEEHVEVSTCTFTKNEDYTKCMSPFDMMPNRYLFGHGYFGARNKNLILSLDQKGEFYTFEYEFDKDSYVISEKRYNKRYNSTDMHIIEYK